MPHCLPAAPGVSSATVATWNCPVSGVWRHKDWRHHWHCPQGHAHSFFMIKSFQFFNTNPLEEDLKQACLFWNVIYTVLSLVGRFQVAYGSKTASPPLEQTWADALCKLNRMLHGAEFYFSWKLFLYHANKEEEKDLMPFLSFKSIQKYLYLARL